MENQFARKNKQTFVGSSVECFKTVVKQLSEFTRIGTRRCIIQLTTIVESNTRFSSVGEHKTHFGLFGQLKIGFKIVVRIKRTADDIYQLNAVHCISLVKPLQIDVIQTILFVQHINHAIRKWLNDNNTRIEIGFFVHIEHNPVDKCP